MKKNEKKKKRIFKDIVKDIGRGRKKEAEGGRD